MRLHVLSKHPNMPCLVVKLKDITVMLDCALDMQCLQHFLPTTRMTSKRFEKLNPWINKELSVATGGQSKLYEIAGRLFVDSEAEFNPPEVNLLDLSTVDIILISSYHNILALPFITEFYHRCRLLEDRPHSCAKYCQFHGKVYATEPTLQIGRLYLEDLVTSYGQVTKGKRWNAWKNRDIQKLLPYPLCDLPDADTWSTLFSIHDVKSALSKVHPLDFSEKRDIYGLVNITALSSGFCIGSCNWLLQTDFHKIVYMASSSVFTTHPQPMDQSAIKDCDVLIVNGLTEAPTTNPDGMLREFCSNLAVTLKNGGNVLVPCYPSGVLYDLFEYLASFLDGSGLSFVPIYFISSIADSSLAYANIYAEWLCQNKQSKVYLPEAPFPHDELVKNGRLKYFSNLQDGLSNNFKTPCIVFTGHPSLRFGDVAHFIDLWGSSSGNTVIFIEPDFPYLEALAPFQPLAMKACYCPIDPRLNFAQANKLIKEFKPKQLLIPEKYTFPPPLLLQRTDLVINVDCPTITYRSLDVIDIHLQRPFEKVTLSNELASELSPVEIETGMAVSSIRGVLSTRDNRHTLNPLSSKKAQGSNASRLLFGEVTVERLIEALEEQGIMGAQWDSTDDGYLIHLPDADAVIQLQEGNTHIINHGNDDLRIKMKDALLTCLVQL